ncbi:glycosyltransferase involved in cell wall biosynthesis [Salinibacter ruber]|uniref:glycosyltransferase family 4 protein n=1 Tax=Salinibacter ruber TaxID=146919 RepID=UPI002167D6CB|nr:glycosyltransferase family 4 protein [Salinibacter ruber]MCS4161424.1 glycosyltransferase involved in cell wall biosynthesis [Salinibacter ruber]
MMNIAYISSSTIPSKKANSVHVMKMCKAFVDKGVDVTLFAKEGNKEKGDPFKYYGINKSFSIRYVSWPPVRAIGSTIYSVLVSLSLGRVSDLDLVYSRHRYALACSLLNNIPFVYEIHTLPKNPLERAVEKFLFTRENFRSLVVISQQLKLNFLKTFDILDNEDIVVLHDAADRPKTRSPVPSVKWPGRSGRLQVGYVGHLYPGKGMEIISKIAPKLRDVDFHIIGGEESDIEKWNNKLGVDNVIFHGYIRHENLSKYYNALDIALCPLMDKVIAGGKNIAKWTSPLKIFEYMSHGLPTVCSDLPVLKEVIIHGHNGLIADNEKPEEWIACIKKLRENVDLRLEISRKATNMHRNKYTWGKRAGRILSELGYI